MKSSILQLRADKRTDGREDFSTFFLKMPASSLQTAELTKSTLSCSKGRICISSSSSDWQKGMLQARPCVDSYVKTSANLHRNVWRQINLRPIAVPCSSDISRHVFRTGHRCLKYICTSLEQLFPLCSCQSISLALLIVQPERRLFMFCRCFFLSFSIFVALFHDCKNCSGNSGLKVLCRKCK